MYPAILTIGQLAKRYGIAAWKVRRVFESGRLPEPERVGSYRVVRESDLPALETALRAAGYLREEVAACL